MCRMLNDFRSWRGCVRPGYVHGGENDCSSEAMKKGENDNVCEILVVASVKCTVGR
jgi:hypothetical protein